MWILFNFMVKPAEDENDKVYYYYGSASGRIEHIWKCQADNEAEYGYDDRNDGILAEVFAEIECG